MNTKSSKKIVPATVFAAIIVLSAMVALAMPVGASDPNYATEDLKTMDDGWSYGSIPCSYYVPAPGTPFTISSTCDGVDITVRDDFLVSDRYEVWVDSAYIGTTPTETCGGSVYSQGTFRVLLTPGDHTLQFKNTCEPCFTGSAPCYDGWLSSGFYYKVEIVDITPPVITCPADVTKEQESAAGTVVPLTATAIDACDADPTITSDELAIYPLGSTVVTFTATDDSGNSASCTTTVTVVDTTPPDISVTVTPDTLWPPNHKMVDITATVTVSDICDANPTVVLTSVTSDEPDNAIGIGDGNTVDDIQGAGIGGEDYEFQLRAERAGTGDGRVYTITYTVRDASGNEASAYATVVVPHDMD
jgi:hypothetical protein